MPPWRSAGTRVALDGTLRAGQAEERRLDPHRRMELSAAAGSVRGKGHRIGANLARQGGVSLEEKNDAYTKLESSP